MDILLAYFMIMEVREDLQNIVIVRAYGNRVACARAPRRVKGQCADAHYMRARPTGLIY